MCIKKACLDLDTKSEYHSRNTLRVPAHMFYTPCLPSYIAEKVKSGVHKSKVNFQAFERVPYRKPNKNVSYIINFLTFCNKIIF